MALTWNKILTILLHSFWAKLDSKFQVQTDCFQLSFPKISSLQAVCPCCIMDPLRVDFHFLGYVCTWGHWKTTMLTSLWESRLHLIPQQFHYITVDHIRIKHKEVCNGGVACSLLKLGSLEKTVIPSLFHSDLHSGTIFCWKNDVICYFG